VHALATSGLGFLLAVLWFDLMFDTQVRGSSARELPTAVRDSIAAYYRRVVTGARPMNRLVALAMLITLGALIGQLLLGDTTVAIAALSLVLAAGAIGLAAARTVPNAVRLGTQLDTAAVQSALARRIFRDHVLCLAAISITLLVQLTLA
jgi:hypothetical protein